MMKKEMTILMPNGYTVKEYYRDMPIEQAVALLCGEQQKEYTCAVRKEGGAEARMIQRRYVCPYCGGEFSGVLTSQEKECKPVSIGRIREWAHPLNEKVFTPKIDFTAFDIQAESVFCPHCGEICVPCSGMNEFRLEQGTQNFSLTYATIDVQELLDLTKETESEMCFEFPIYEKILFYPERRQVFLELRSENGRLLVSYNITRTPAMWRRASVYRVGFRYEQIIQAVRQCLEESQAGALPFQNQELTPERLMMLIRFPGFARSFYEALPFQDDTWELAPSFQKSVRSLSSPEQAREAFFTSSLPKIHSVRKLFFEQQGLLFYLKECEALWQVLKDPNLLCRVLRADCTFRILSDLHTYPGAVRFLRDLCRTKGGVFLVNQMRRHWNSLFAQAFHYCNGNAQIRKELLSGKYRMIDEIRSMQDYSIPICTAMDRIKDIRIKGFRFWVMRTWNECRTSGRELHNCLAAMTENDVRNSTLVCIQAGRKIVGAVEVNAEGIVQAYAAYNHSLDSVPGLEEAFEIWVESSGLRGAEIF